MRRRLPHLLALVLGLAAAFAVGCGSGEHLIPADDAGRLKDRIAAVEDAIQAGDCERAAAAADQAVASGRLLGPPIDRRLRRRVNEGLRALRERTPQACREAQTETTTTPTTTTETTPTTTTPTTTTPTTTTPTTTPTTPTTTTPTETTTTPPTDTTGSDSGGTGAPQP